VNVVSVLTRLPGVLFAPAEDRDSLANAEAVLRGSSRSERPKEGAYALPVFLKEHLTRSFVRRTQQLFTRVLIVRALGEDGTIQSAVNLLHLR